MATTGLINSGLYPHARDTNQFVRISRAIQANLDLFKGKNVLSVRPGYKVVDGWPTRKPAIVAVVETKTDAVEKADILPAKVDGFAVDVRQASSAEKLRVQNPRRYAQLNASAPREFALPEFADEISPESKQALMSAVPPLIEEARATKPEIDYSVPSGVTLDLIDEPMSIVCHAGPDAAWQQLARFLSEVQSTLTVGMYDFTSAHVLNAVEQAMQHAGGEFTLTLDHPAKNKSADQSDEETVADLGTNLPATFQSAWALVRSSRMASKWIYPTAYHIKVAVRDSASNDPAMWLSSGNWNNSNQADISVDPADLRDWSEQAKKFDRDWHIVVNHAGLARTYEAFLENDFRVANQIATGGVLEAEAAAPMPTAEDLIPLEPMALPVRAAAKHFDPLRIPQSGTRKIKIQPILTPDNYYHHVLDLIRSAGKTFYMQTQYIHPSDKEEDQQFADLINAVADLQKAGVLVRLILSQWQVQGSGGWLEKLQAAGIDLVDVKIQNGVHNKGIVVDSRIVMLGSQNWSGDGVLRNRDASLIIDDREAAAYYEQIFLHDWANLAAQTTPR